MKTKPAFVWRAPGCLGALVLYTSLTLSCKVDKQEFDNRIFSCNPSAFDPACGTDDSGKANSCVAAYQLGGSNFCSQSCDIATSKPDGENGSICLASGARDSKERSGALLKQCDPASTATSDTGCGQTGLSCVRTDMINNEGVCMTTTPCKTGSDCHDPVRAVCIGELLHDTYGDKSGLKPDHTYCVQAGCNATGAACSPGESCLRKLISKESNPADICVPNCDSNRNCPPNYICYPDLYSKPSPAICLPGLMGLRCRTRMDCLFGDCLPTGAGFNVCTTTCAVDGDCAKFDSEQGTFFCDEKSHQCAGPRAFRGSICNDTSDCRVDKGEVCGAMPGFPSKLCLIPCTTPGSCAAYGGVPHVCEQSAVPKICFPGYLGIPCNIDTECLKDLTCQNTAVIPVLGTLKTCTAVCGTDADCTNNRFAKDGWCLTAAETLPDAPHGICRPFLNEGDTCNRSAQCTSRVCNIPAGAKTGLCTKVPGY